MSGAPQPLWLMRLRWFGIVERWKAPVLGVWFCAVIYTAWLNGPMTSPGVRAGYLFALLILPILGVALRVSAMNSTGMIPQIDALDDKEALGPLIDALDFNDLRRLFVPTRLTSDAIRDAAPDRREQELHE